MEIYKSPKYFDGCEDDIWPMLQKTPPSNIYIQNVTQKIICKSVLTNLHNLSHISDYLPDVKNVNISDVKKSNYEKNYWPLGFNDNTNHYKQIVMFDSKPLYEMVKKLDKSDCLCHVSLLCKNLEVNPNTIKKNRTESLLTIVDRMSEENQNDNIYKIKTGVYYLTKSNSVLKFLVNKERIEESIREIFFGLILENIKGVVPIKHVYPEAFCFEMPFVGLSIEHIICNIYDSSRYLNQKSFLKKIIENQTCFIDEENLVRCKMSTTEKVNSFIHNATKKLFYELPYIFAEIVNILTRLANLRLVHLDIKPDNIVLDLCTYQPYIIDMGFMTLIGTKYSNDFYVDEKYHKNYPQSPPELLCSELCTKESMIYGLAYTFYFILERLKEKHYNILTLYENLLFKKWFKNARQRSPQLRSNMNDIIPIIQGCFTLSPVGQKLFLKKNLTIYN
nr:MAG: wsv423-like protein [Metapenaeopsis lamellata majanivirus]